MATLHLKPRIEPENYVSITVNIGGRVFPFTYDIPDVTGNVSATDHNRKWIDEQLRSGLQGRFGKLIPQEA